MLSNPGVGEVSGPAHDSWTTPLTIFERFCWIKLGCCCQTLGGVDQRFSGVKAQSAHLMALVQASWYVVDMSSDMKLLGSMG